MRAQFAALGAAALCLLSQAVSAQTIHPDVADSQIPQIGKDLDKRHFDAFNQCKLDALRAMYAPDAEFYHDRNGRILNREQLIAAVQRNICGKAQRRLIESSLEVYPLAKVGLLLIGKHCFLEVGQANCIQTGRFHMLWRFDGKDWQLTRMFSYDHQDLAPMDAPRLGLTRMALD